MKLRQMNLGTLICVGFCDLLLHRANRKMQITEGLANWPVCSSDHTARHQVVTCTCVYLCLGTHQGTEERSSACLHLMMQS